MKTGAGIIGMACEVYPDLKEARWHDSGLVLHMA